MDTSFSQSTFFLRAGFGASDGGYRPFLDLWDVENGVKQRIWQCQKEYFETVSSIMNDPGSEPLNLRDMQLLARRESKDLSPQYFVINFKSPKNDQSWESNWRQISEFDHPYPSLKEMTKEILRYKREDGVDLNGTLYLPPGKNFIVPVSSHYLQDTLYSFNL